MSAQKAHSLLSDLYRILATYQAADFTEASRISPEMAGIVDAIRNRAENRRHSSSVHLANKSRTTSSLQQSSISSQQINSATEILLALKRSTYFSTVRELESLAQRYGIRLKSRPKEGRERFARRLSQSFFNIPTETRETAMRDIAEHATSQTAGWVDILRGR